jgi:hypothetical protein
MNNSNFAGSTGAVGSSATSPNRLTPRSNPNNLNNSIGGGSSTAPALVLGGKKKKGLKIDCT